MAAKHQAATMLLLDLPSITIPDFAAAHGVSIAVLGEYIRAERLQCHVLLHERLQFYSRRPGDSDTAEEITLEGHYRLPVRSAAAVLDGTANGTEVELRDGRTGVLPGCHLTVKHLRVLKEERERFERDVLARRPPERPEATRPSTWDRARCQAVAAYMWQKDPSATIADMAESQAMKDACEGRPYAKSTITTWIHLLCPDRRPGRRPN